MKGYHCIAGNQLALLQNGVEFFPQLCAAIDAARHSVHLETYIFAADETGHMVSSALQRAARRGVVVRILLDGFGSAELPRHWVNELLEAGGEVQWFRRDISPFTLRRNRKRRLLRMHRKLAAVDGEVAFVGGINIIDDVEKYYDCTMPRLDYAVRVQGAVSGEIHAAMRRLWGVVLWANLHRRGKEFRRIILDNDEHVQTSIAFLLRDNLRHRRDIERSYLKSISGAQHEIIIANAYFLPGRIFLRALKRAALRGVRVVLLLQGRVEYRLQHYATHALYDRLLAAGVEIYEYQASYLHAKVAVVDGQWSTVGSSNIDPFSLLLAREANLAILDEGFAKELRASLLEAIGNDAVRVRNEYCGAFNFIGRLAARLSYGAVRLMIGMLGYGRHSSGAIHPVSYERV